MSQEASSSTSGRDRFALTYEQLLEDHAAISRERKNAAAACAMRHQSRQYLDVLAVEAMPGCGGWAELRATCKAARDHQEQVSVGSLTALGEIGRVLLLHPVAEEDAALGLFLIEQPALSMPANLRNRLYRQLLVQALIERGETSRALEYLDKWPDLNRIEHGYLRGEVWNPFRNEESGDWDRWLEQFNMSFTADGLEPVTVDVGAQTPFDGLTATASSTHEWADVEWTVESEPLVSVVLTAFQPELAELRTSVLSILNQTVKDLELIVVNDCSGADYVRVFETIAGLDPRIRVIDLAENSGTYVARNAGFAEATGKFFTGQDDDDWSHPERLERQVAFLLDNPTAVGCRVHAITCTPDLSRLRLAYAPTASNASSLMVRRGDFRRTGGFLAMRKAADTEFKLRLEAITKRVVEDLPERLTVVRILTESLSRSEFRSGWSHPARRQFKSSYATWHADAEASDLQILSSTEPPVCVPRRFRVERPAEEHRDHYDVILAGDWRQYGGPQKSMIEEIKALRKGGLRVAVLHLEAPRFMTVAVKPMTPHIQRLINSGVVDEVLYDDAVSTDLLILRYPPILQFAPDLPSAIAAEQMFILANQAPSELDGRDIRYTVPECDANARRIFTENVTWVPQGPQAREAIAPYLRPEQLEDFDMPGILDPAEWATPIPRRPRGLLPVVGRHSRDNAMKWPSDPKVLQAVYPTDGSVDVRIMGGASVPAAVLDRSTPPPAWVAFPTDALPVPEFLRSLDFFVFFQNPVAVEAFGRAILEAVATNLVVILPRHYEAVFGEAALYVAPDEVRGLIRRYSTDRDLYVTQQRRAQRVVAERFSHAAYLEQVRGVLHGTVGEVSAE